MSPGGREGSGQVVSILYFSESPIPCPLFHSCDSKGHTSPVLCRANGFPYLLLSPPVLGFSLLSSTSTNTSHPCVSRKMLKSIFWSWLPSHSLQLSRTEDVPFQFSLFFHHSLIKWEVPGWGLSYRCEWLSHGTGVRMIALAVSAEEWVVIYLSVGSYLFVWPVFHSLPS